MRKYGFSFSWKKAIGLSAQKGKLSRRLGIPLTRSGRQQKIGRSVGCLLPLLVLVLIPAFAISAFAVWHFCRCTSSRTHPPNIAGRSRILFCKYA